MTQPPAPDWSTRLALSIATEVRRHRQAQGLSAQQLSDRCAELGMPIQRSVLANLESGRRTTVTVAEVLVLAAALNIPPALLTFPVGQTETVEFLPGDHAEALDAVDWLGGVRPLNSKIPFRQNALFLNRRHRNLVRSLRQLLAQREDVRAEYAQVKSEDAGEQVRAARLRLLQAREEADAAQQRLNEAITAGDESSLPRVNLLKAEVAVTTLSNQVRELERKAGNAAYFERHLESLDQLIRERSMDLEKVRIDMRDGGLVLPRLRDDLYGLVHDMQGGEFPDMSVDDLTEE